VWFDLDAVQKRFEKIEASRIRLAKLIAHAENDGDAALLDIELVGQTKAAREARADR
jgi:hypothetical protein